jgi:hemerythrin superfamily protein
MKKKKGPQHMNAIQLLKKDHKKVKDLFKKYEELEEESTEREKICREVLNDLDTHTRVEEEIFYPAVADLSDEKPQKLVREAIEEHAVAKELVHELMEMDVDDPQYDAKMQVLMENVKHHIREEEGEMFPAVQRKIDNDRLGEEMLEMKERIEGGIESDKRRGTSRQKEEHRSRSHHR